MILRTAARLAFATVFSSLLSTSWAQQPDFLTREQKAEDFATFCRFVSEEYAYFDLKRTDWDRACKVYAPQAEGAADKMAYIEVLEQALAEIYDSHAHLAINTPRSFRLVPTHSELVAAWSGGKAIVTDVRRGSGAEKGGVLVGMEVVSIGGEPVEKAVAAIAPRFLTGEDPAARDWALRVALAGRRDRGVIRLSTRLAGEVRELEFAPSFPEPTAPLSSRVVGKVGYIRIHNSLGQDALVPAFDRALAGMPEARALVIDLRDTPSGGNSSVARGMMGRLVARTLPYQRHELVSESRSTGIRRVWVEYVVPRGTTFLGPVVVLAGPWTASMGEGLAIGFNATRGAPVLGRPMAHLLGANGEAVLPNSKIVVRVPTERLFHVDGRPRGAFLPCAVARPNAASPDEDRELVAAIALASKMSNAGPSATADRSATTMRCASAGRGERQGVAGAVRRGT